ncbi:MAG TPA: hypothetical protein VKG67_00590 [Gallionellaceae bacterium]|nr:hypothetical protein [Gallionellaceae bacterium]
MATPFLIIRAVEHGDIGFIIGASVFAAAMILLYSASPLSRLAARKAQAYFPYHRTSRNFSPDRRHIHSVLSRHIARWMGRVAPLTIFSITPMAKPQIIPSNDQPHRFHQSLSAHGLAHRVASVRDGWNGMPLFRGTVVCGMIWLSAKPTGKKDSTLCNALW